MPRSPSWLSPAVTERFAEIDQATWADITPLTSDGGARYATFWDWLGAHMPDEPCWLLDAEIREGLCAAYQEVCSGAV
jgi:hypothetical protein